MTSGWGSGQRTGELRDQVRGDGSGGRTLRQGSALPLIRVVSLVLTLLCVVLAVVTLKANGLLVLAVVFLAVFIWSIGAHRASFWN